MGCFDRVIVPCPECGDTVEFQSKVMGSAVDYPGDSVPDLVALDVHDGWSTCSGCGLHVRAVAEPARHWVVRGV